MIWDVDGTLVDTAELHFDAWKKVCEELGRPFARADFAATFGRRNPEIMKELFGDRFSTAEVDAVGVRKEDFYRAAARRQGVTLLPGVRPLLEGLRQAGFRQAVGSSAPRENVDLILSLTDTASFFGGISAMEDTQRGKPDPQVFLIAADRIGKRSALTTALCSKTLHCRHRGRPRGRNARPSASPLLGIIPKPSFPKVGSGSGMSCEDTFSARRSGSGENPGSR